MLSCSGTVGRQPELERVNSIRAGCYQRATAFAVGTAAEEEVLPYASLLATRMVSAHPATAEGSMHCPKGPNQAARIVGAGSSELLIALVCINRQAYIGIRISKVVTASEPSLRAFRGGLGTKSAACDTWICTVQNMTVSEA